MVLKSTNEDQGGDVGTKSLPPLKQVGNMLDIGVDCVEGGRYHIANDRREIAWEELDVRLLLNQVGALVQSYKSPRLDLTEKEQEWYSTIWNYDWNVSDGLLMLGYSLEMPGFSCDKTISGEYILGRPPKKPGGPRCSNTLLKIYLIGAIMIACAEFAAGDSSEGIWRSEAETR